MVKKTGLGQHILWIIGSLVQHIKSPIRSFILLCLFHTIFSSRVHPAKHFRVKSGELQLSVHDVFGYLLSSSPHQWDYSNKRFTRKSNQSILYSGLKRKSNMNWCYLHRAICIIQLLRTDNMCKSYHGKRLGSSWKTMCGPWAPLSELKYSTRVPLAGSRFEVGRIMMQLFVRRRSKQFCIWNLTNGRL